MSAPSKRHVLRPHARAQQYLETFCGATVHDNPVRWDDRLQAWVESCCGRPAMPGTVCRVCANLATRWMTAQREWRKVA